jgi:peptide/nickel transport system substrate-binding protein
MKDDSQKPARAISRRQFLRLSAVAGATMGLAACGGEPPAVIQPTAAPAAAEPTAATVAEPTAAPVIPTAPAVAPTTAPVAADTKFSEAPMLAELVSSGGLPAVDQRLPKNPVVLDGLDGVGKFGGSLRRGFRGVSDRWGPTKIQNESLTWYNSDFSLRANIAESWEVNDDATQWTFRLREGMKWSDGTDFTTDDWKWWHENVLMNTTLTQSPPAQWSTGSPRVAMKAEFPDKYTAVFTFANPKPLFVYNVTREQPWTPSAFMKELHIDFTADKAKLEADAKAASFETWDLYFIDRNNWWTIGRPTTGPWMATNELSQQQFVMERNPFFWQVDSSGQQLPYVDKITHLLFEQPDAFNTRIIAGEVDFQARHVSIGDFTLLKENESKGDYQVLLGVSANHLAFQPNHTAKNKNVREFFQSRQVRQALSVAIDRAEINDLTFNGTATPRQYSPLKESPQYYEKLSNAFIEYDADKANALLDEAGYTEKGADGMRMWKDGSGPVSFVIEGTAQAGSPDEDAVQTMVKYFAAVGVQATYKAQERSLYTERYEANEIDSAFWGGDRTLLPIVAPWIFLGSMVDRPWAAAWGNYYNNPQNPNAEEPPADHFIRKIWSIQDQIDVEPDDAKRNELFKGILDIWAEELPMIGILGELPAPTIMRNGLKGYKAGIPNDDTTEDENLPNTQAYYWDDPAAHTS